MVNSIVFALLMPASVRRIWLPSRSTTPAYAPLAATMSTWGSPGSVRGRSVASMSSRTAQ